MLWSGRQGAGGARAKHPVRGPMGWGQHRQHQRNCKTGAKSQRTSDPGWDFLPKSAANLGRCGPSCWAPSCRIPSPQGRGTQPGTPRPCLQLALLAGPQGQGCLFRGPPRKVLSPPGQQQPASQTQPRKSWET